MPILPVAIVTFVIFASLAQPMFIKVQQKLSYLNTVLQENLAGIKVIKAFTREKEQQAKFSHAADETMNQQIAVSRLFTFMFPFIFLVANLGQAAILYVGGKQIIAGHAQPWRLAGVLDLFDVPVLPHHDVRHDRHADGTGRRVCRTYLRNSGCEIRYRG